MQGLVIGDCGDMSKKHIGDKIMNNITLQTYLRQEAGDLLYRDYAIVNYIEDTNPDVPDGTWFDHDTSFIWKVGVLSIVDRSKNDWAYLLIGHQRNPDANCELIGKLHWANGESDDIGRSLLRYLKCAKQTDVLFVAQPFT